MTVKHEIKSQLAKLLATEDLVVEHRKVSTAQFNVHDRVLTLPMWDKASNTVYDLLVGHEVGHALFTPDENWLEKKKIPPQFVNVVEDARIEKMMKRKYAGLSKTFYNGYKELNEEDFFSISDESVADFNLADRANLYFKIGNFLDFTFTDEERAIILMIQDCETFDDVLDTAEVLYKYCKKKVEQPEKQSIDASQSEQQSQDEQEQQSPESKPDGMNEETSEEGENTDDSIEEPEVQTADALSEAIDQLAQNSDGIENVYVEVPKVNLDTVIVSNDLVHQYVDHIFDRQERVGLEMDMQIFEECDKEYSQFKRSAQKEVNYLVKEFECKKAADSYARATTSRTGVLDCTKLHTYKYNEDLFRKVTTLADGKNHGLVFLLDWSGSMQYTLLDTCKQMFNLLWFCKKVGIPFDVYAFTNEWSDGNEEGFYHESVEHYEKKENLLCVPNDFNLLNILTSKVSGKDMEHQMINIWRHAVAFCRVYRCSYTWGRKMTLSGTPLNEALVSLHQILPKFQRENKLQKVQCVVLTDGEACPLSRHKLIKRYWENDAEFLGHARHEHWNTILRDRKTGNMYNFKSGGFNGFSDVMLNNLKDNFPTVNFVGIRLLAPRDANGFIKMYSDTDSETTKLQTEWRKEKSFVIRNSGYDAYFGMSCAALAQDIEFEVDEGATKAKIKSAFVKSLKTKKLNKKVLGEFISLVA
jgi:hypothetical protein